jgi:phosphoglycolate phosphatase
MMKEEQIFLDMDGTIVSYHERFYKVYRNAYIIIGEIPLTKDKWLEARRSGDIKYPPGIREKLDPYFRNMFESKEYLKYDKIYPGIKDVILNLKEKYPIKIVSFRGNDINLREQLSNFGICGLETIIQEYCSGTPCDEKARMIQRIVQDPKGWIIGDTHYEIIAGKKLGLKTIAVTYGDQSEEFLRTYSPDYIVDSPSEILEIIR